MMLITQRVEGYVDERSGTFLAYKDLQQRDANLRAQSRNFRTTGVVLCVDRSWFKGDVKRSFVNRLRDVFIREYSVAPQDVGVAWSNISFQQWDRGGVPGGCVAIFDETYGSLRLTERIYDRFEHLLDRAAAGASAEEDGELEEVVLNVKCEFLSFTMDALQQELREAPRGHEQVFAPGSEVCYRKAGAIAVDVVVLQPTMMDGELMYQIEIKQKVGQSPVKNWIRASAVEPSANTANWSYRWWNRETQEYEEPPESSR